MSDASIDDINSALDKAFGPGPEAKTTKADEPDISEYANIGAESPDPNLTLGQVGQVATGAIAAIPGSFGDIESLGRKAINAVGGDVDEETTLPTTEKIANFMSGPTTDESDTNYRNLGELLSPGALYGAGLAKAAKAAKAATATGRAAELAGEVKSGELGKTILESPKAASEARKAAADTAYANADTAMAAKQAQLPWQESPSGRAFLDELEKRISTVGTTKEAGATRAQLQQIHDDLLGARDPGGGTAYSEPNVLREILRRVRKAAEGKPVMGAEAIDKIRAGSLAKDLAKSIEDWEPSLAKADAKYGDLSADLYPEGVIPGKFAKEFDQAKRAINDLEISARNGSITKTAVDRVRSLIDQQNVKHLIDPSTAQALNKRLDKIDSAARRGKAYRTVGKYAAGGLAGGLGLHYGSRLFGGH